MLVVALFPSVAAVIVAVPGATPTTIPEFETVAFAASDVLHEKVRGNGSPAAVLADAVSCSVAAGTKVAVSRETVTDATVGAGGPTIPSPPPQDPISQARVKTLMDRYNLVKRGAFCLLKRQRADANHRPHVSPSVVRV
jgi:hypothetical protein